MASPDSSTGNGEHKKTEKDVGGLSDFANLHEEVQEVGNTFQHHAGGASQSWQQTCEATKGSSQPQYGTETSKISDPRMQLHLNELNEERIIQNRFDKLELARQARVLVNLRQPYFPQACVGATTRTTTKDQICMARRASSPSSQVSGQSPSATSFGSLVGATSENFELLSSSGIHSATRSQVPLVSSERESSIPFPTFEDKTVQRRYTQDEAIERDLEASVIKLRHRKRTDSDIPAEAVSSPQSLARDAKTIRTESLERIRLGLQRRRSSAVTSPEQRAQIDSISGVDTPFGLGRGGNATLPSPFVISDSANAAEKAKLTAIKDELSSLPPLLESLSPTGSLLTTHSSIAKNDCEQNTAAPTCGTTVHLSDMAFDHADGERDRSERTTKTSNLRAIAPAFVPISTNNSPSKDSIAPSIDEGENQSSAASNEIGSALKDPSFAVSQRTGLKIGWTNQDITISEEASVTDSPPKSTPSADQIFVGGPITPKKSILKPPACIIDEATLSQIWPRFQNKDEGLQSEIGWRYAESHETAESITKDYPGVISHYRPVPLDFDIRPIISAKLGISMNTPAILMETRSGINRATAQYDPSNNVWRIFSPSYVPSRDERSCRQHPDYLSPEQMKIVQGMENWGYRLYNSKRLYFKCFRDECENETNDAGCSAPCFGCGPLSRVRYCSTECLIDDIGDHWEVCGSQDFFLPAYFFVDVNESLPARMLQMYPMIEDIHGWKSKARFRAHMSHILLQGNYALFPLADMSCYMIQFDRRDDKDVTLRDRMVRIINCLLLDHTLQPLIAYLYLIVRDALFAQINTRVGEYPIVLRLQIRNEWNFDHKGPLGYKYLDDIESCDCIWFGKDNSPDCRDGCRAWKGIPGEYERIGLRSLVVKMEKESWLLRAWRHRHPSVFDWRERVLGKGFAGVRPRHFKHKLPVLGIGYNGWIDDGKPVGSWKKKLILNAPAPEVIMDTTTGIIVQKPGTFLWRESEAKS